MQFIYPRPAIKFSAFKSSFGILFCVICVLSSFAANAQNLDVIFKDTLFISATGKEVQTRDSAFYVRVLSPFDSSRVSVKEYYLNGKLNFSGTSLSVDKLTLDGPVLTFFPDGKKKAELNYKNGSLKGLSYYYYHNGALQEIRDYGDTAAGKWANGPGGSYLLSIYRDSTGKVMVEHGNGYLKELIFSYSQVILEGNVINGKQEGEWKLSDSEGQFKTVEKFKDGLLIEGICRLKGGRTCNFNDYEMAPEFPGGQVALRKYINTHLGYPDALKRAGIEGVVLANFVVGRTGQAEDAKILRSAQKDLDDEVIRLIKEMPLWQPGIQNGIPVRILYTIPIAFRLH